MDNNNNNSLKGVHQNGTAIPMPNIKVSDFKENDLVKYKSAAGGIKFDLEKPRYTLLDAKFTEGMAKVMTFGATKYGDFNWKGLNPDRLLNSAYRHLQAIAMGEENDVESGMPHSHHVAVNMMMYQHLINLKDEV